MDGVIRAHCMGTVFPTFEEQASYRKLIEDAALLWRDMAKTEFPKRDTDGPNVTWKSPKALTAAEIIAIAREFYGFHSVDLDAVAEEQRVKEKTSAQVPNR